MNNLIGNAIKFSYQDTKIIVKVVKDNENIITSVTDQGQGIPERELQEIFNAFHKSSAKPTAGEKSTGLGLAITKSIVERHGGKNSRRKPER